jgi:hypothetical protein
LWWKLYGLSRGYLADDLGRERAAGRVKEMSGNHPVILIHRCGKTCGLLEK